MRRTARLPASRLRRAAWLWVAGLAGCAAPPTVAPPAPATIEAPIVAPASAQATGSPTWSWTDQLGASAQRLRGGLHGDRVAVSQTTDLRLWVSLPTDTAFAPGRAAVKPPATGWLDQVALALRDLPRAEVQIVSDADAGGSESGARVLALERAASARDWLVIRGVSPRRISVAGRSSPRGVRATEPRRLDILIGERARTPGDNAK